jgi:hypothetical protein
MLYLCLLIAKIKMTEAVEARGVSAPPSYLELQGLPAFAEQSPLAVFAMLSEEGALERRAENLQEEINGGDSQLTHAVRLENAVRSTSEQGYALSDKGEFPDAKAKLSFAERIRDSRAKMFGSTVVAEALKRMEMSGQMATLYDATFWGEDARKLQKVFADSEPAHDSALDAAANQIEIEEKYDSIRDTKFFIPSKKLQSLIDTDSPSILIEYSQSNGPVEIPLTNVVSAGGFDNWGGRDGGSGRKSLAEDGDDRVVSSAEVIKRYAEKETGIPPISGITAYIQPNGMVVYDVPNDNHRTAAAMVKGDKTIKLEGAMVVGKLTKDILQPRAVEHKG